MRIATQWKDLTIGVLYSYLDGEKEHTRALDPWFIHTDHIIAVNGRYKTPLSPDMRRKNLSNYSTDNSEDLLKSEYRTKITQDKFYGTQLEKRQKCFDIAAELGCDIVITVDTDDYIHTDYQDWNRFFSQIAHVYEYNPDELVFKMYYWIPTAEDWSPQFNAVEHETWVKYDRIHRDPGNLRYSHSHYTWCLKDVTDQQIDEWKWAHESKPYSDNPFYKLGNTIIDGVRFTTNRNLRTKDQRMFGDEWAWQNMHWESYEFDIKPYWHHKGFELVYEGLKKSKYPNLEYYFSNDDKAILIPYFLDKEGRYVIIKPDMTEEVLQEALAK